MSGYTRSNVFRPGTFLKPCGICGLRFRNTELVRGEDGFYRCLRWCVEVPAITRDKISAESQKRREAPPPPNGEPFDRRSTYAQEEQIFNLLCEMSTGQLTGGLASGNVTSAVLATSGGPATTLAVTTTTSTRFGDYAEIARYLYGVITEGKRPKSWISIATARLGTIADNLYASVNGFGSNTTMTLAANFNYGSLSSIPSLCNDNAQTGLALLYAYRILGTPKYLAAAQGACHFLRNMQSVGKCMASDFTSADAAGTVRLYTGGIVNAINTSAQSDHGFYPSSMVALEFFRELLATVGDGSYGCPGTAGGAFATAPQANLSQMIADFRAFWAVGAYDVIVGKTFTGLSPTTPAEYFNAYPASHPGFSGRQGTGSGSWEYQDAGSATGTLVSGSNFAQAIRSLFAYEGYTPQVSGVWTWLMSFASNAAFVSPVGTLASDYACQITTLAANPPAPPAGQGNVVAPFYDPTLALTTLLLVRDSTSGYAAIAKNGSSLYDWSTTGMMAAIQASQNTGALKTAKGKLVTAYTRLPVAYSDSPAVVVDYLMLRGTSGLAFQLNQADNGANKLWDGGKAARIGAVFRSQPQAWTGTNPPQQQPGVGT